MFDRYRQLSMTKNDYQHAEITQQLFMSQSRKTGLVLDESDLKNF